MKDDGFETQRALTREFRQALDVFAEDARRLVRDEVAHGSPDPEEWAALARRVAADEVRQSVTRRGVSWPTALAGAGVALGVVALAVGVGRMVETTGPTRGESPPAAPVAAADPPPPNAGTAHPAWIRFDSVFATRDSSLLRLVQDASLLDSTSAGLVRIWWEGAGAPSQETLDALVRIALRNLADSTSVPGPVSADLMARLIVLRAVESP